MDPNEVLKKIRELTSEHGATLNGDACYDLNELKELVESLDQWLSKGGFLPKDWEKRANMLLF